MLPLFAFINLVFFLQVAQLPQRLSLNLDDLCARNPFSDVCASIWTLSTVIGYLAKVSSFLAYVLLIMHFNNVSKTHFMLQVTSY